MRRRISEVRGEVPLVNGTIFPSLEVEPRKYRFRVLNASNGRLYRLSLSPRKVNDQISAFGWGQQQVRDDDGRGQ
jgi:spore coat protein A